MTGTSEYVFTSRAKIGNPIKQNTIWKELHQTGIGKEVATVHGFRATARTLLEEALGERYELIEHQLAHTIHDPNGKAYNRTTHLSERKRMMERWGQYFDNLRKGSLNVQLFVPAYM